MSGLVEEYRGRRGGGRHHWGGRRYGYGGGWGYPYYSSYWNYPYYYPTTTTIIKAPAETAAPVKPGISQTNLLLLIMTIALVMILMMGVMKK